MHPNVDDIEVIRYRYFIRVDIINLWWCGVMVARNVVVNILAHDKPVPIPVRFRVRISNSH